MLEKRKAYFAIDSSVSVREVPESCGAIYIFVSSDSALKFTKDPEAIIEMEYDINDLRKVIMDVARRVVFTNGRASFAMAKSVPIETSNGVDELNAI